VRVQEVDRSLLDERAQRFGEGRVRDDEVFVATAGENDRAGCVRGASELRGDARLPNARLAPHEYDASLACGGGLPLLGEPLALRSPPGERKLAAD
jgi:hypothetical protein